MKKIMKILFVAMVLSYGVSTLQANKMDQRALIRSKRAKDIAEMERRRAGNKKKSVAKKVVIEKDAMPKELEPLKEEENLPVKVIIKKGEDVDVLRQAPTVAKAMAGRQDEREEATEVKEGKPEEGMVKVKIVKKEGSVKEPKEKTEVVETEEDSEEAVETEVEKVVSDDPLKLVKQIKRIVNKQFKKNRFKKKQVKKLMKAKKKIIRKLDKLNKLLELETEEVEEE